MSADDPEDKVDAAFFAKTYTPTEIAFRISSCANRLLRLVNSGAPSSVLLKEVDMVQQRIDGLKLRLDQEINT